MNASEMFLKCLEEEGVEYIFGIPGEENIAFMDALLNSKIKFILTRHEQAASIMADIYGHCSGKAGVCLATLGPGAINLALGTAAAFQDYNPLVAIAGQRGSNTLFQESHQVIDIVGFFAPITKWGAEIDSTDEIPGYVRKAFRIATEERYGSTILVLPEDVADLPVSEGVRPIHPARQAPTDPEPSGIDAVYELIRAAKNPVVIAGGGIVRSGATDELREFAGRAKIPVIDLPGSRGVLDNRDPGYLAPLGFMTRDYANFAIDRADLIVAIGFDFIEYFPRNFNRTGKAIVNISAFDYEVDAAFEPEVSVIGNIRTSLKKLAGKFSEPIDNIAGFSDIVQARKIEQERYNGTVFTGAVKPEKLIAELRKTLTEDDVLICDTGAIKEWVLRLYPVYNPENFILSNGLATMSIALPGAIGAKLARPEKNIVAIMGDGSFLMNSQEIETAKRLKIPIVIFIWRDSTYGLIKWRGEMKYGRPSNIAFENPDFVRYAESFGIKAFRIESSDDIGPVLKKAIGLKEVVLIDCPVDYSDNNRLVQELAALDKTLSKAI